MRQDTVQAVEQFAAGAAKATTVTYAGLTMAGVSVHEWASILAICTSLCLLTHYLYKFAVWVAVKWRARRPA